MITISRPVSSATIFSPAFLQVLKDMAKKRGIAVHITDIRATWQAGQVPKAVRPEISGFRSDFTSSHSDFTSFHSDCTSPRSEIGGLLSAEARRRRPAEIALRSLPCPLVTGRPFLAGSITGRRVLAFAQI